jgi:hypothetical protein
MKMIAGSLTPWSLWTRERVIDEAISSGNACFAGAAATAIATGIQLGAEKGESISYSTSHDKSP